MRVVEGEVRVVRRVAPRAEVARRHQPVRVPRGEGALQPLVLLVHQLLLLLVELMLLLLQEVAVLLLVELLLVVVEFARELLLLLFSALLLLLVLEGVRVALETALLGVVEFDEHGTFFRGHDRSLKINPRDEQFLIQAGSTKEGQHGQNWGDELHLRTRGGTPSTKLACIPGRESPTTSTSTNTMSIPTSRATRGWNEKATPPARCGDQRWRALHVISVPALLRRVVRSKSRVWRVPTASQAPTTRPVTRALMRASPEGPRWGSAPC